MYKKKIIIILFLSVKLIGNTVVSAEANQLDDALSAEREVVSEQDKVRNIINQLTFTTDRIKKQISELDSQIFRAQTTLNQKQHDFQQASEQLDNTQKELDQLQIKLEERRKTASLRIRAIYIQGNIGYLELLFDATDLSDFITQVEYLKYIVESDRNLLVDLRVRQQEVREKSDKLQLIRDQTAKAREEAAIAKINLETKLQEQKNLLNETKKQQQEEWEEVERLEREAENWRKQILKLQEQFRSSNPSRGNGQVSDWPVPGYNEISSPFGWRINPISKKRAKHLGIDIPAPNGTPIIAAASGTVVFSGWDNIYGNWVIIDIGSGITTSYGHNSRNAVKVGQTVEAGDIIAYVGSTGWSTGSHLDFGVRINGNPVDPLGYFR